MPRRFASLLALLGLSVVPACGNSDSSSASPATDAATDARTDVPTTHDAALPPKKSGSKPDAASSLPGKDAGHSLDASGSSRQDAATVMDASIPEGGRGVVSADAGANASEASTCGHADLLRALPQYVEALNFGPSCVAKTPVVNLRNCPVAETDLTSCTSGTCAGNAGCTLSLSWHDATVVGETLTVLLDISGSMPFLYESNDVGCTGSPLSCVLAASIAQVKYTLVLGSTDAGTPHLTVTNLKTELPPLTSSGCTTATQTFNTMLPYVEGTFGSLATFLGTELRDSVEARHCP